MAQQAAKTARPRARRALLRPRKPLTERELTTVFERVKKRVLAGGEPFGVFVIGHGRGRVFQLLGVNAPQYKNQLRVNQARQHLVAVYDADANLAHVWDDLTSFDKPAESAANASGEGK